MSAEFLATALIVCLLPGTGVVYTLAVGLGRGFGPSLVAALGCTLGIVPHATLSIVGLAAVLHASPIAFETLRWLGVLYLLWMAWSILRGGGPLALAERAEPVGAARLVVDGVLLNALNPKLSVFFLAFLPQFVAPGAGSPTRALVGLALAFMIMTFVTFALYGAFAAAARDRVLSRPGVLRWLERAFAAAFVLLGLRLALGR